MRGVKTVVVVLIVAVQFSCHAGENKSAEEVLLEMRHVIDRIELMHDFRSTKNSDLESFIECSIDNDFWDTHGALRDENKSSKYSADEIKQMQTLHMSIVHRLGEYRKAFPEAECGE